MAGEAGTLIRDSSLHANFCYGWWEGMDSFIRGGADTWRGDAVVWAAVAFIWGESDTFGCQTPGAGVRWYGLRLGSFGGRLTPLGGRRLARGCGGRGRRWRLLACDWGRLGAHARCIC